MGNPFSKEFWVGSGPGQSTFQPWTYSPDVSAFSTGEQGRELSRMLMRRAQGQVPSVAELQMQQGLGRALAASQAMARSDPRIGAGLAQRLAGQRAGNLMAQTNMQAGQLRAQEQAAAETRLGGWLNQQMQAKMTLEQLRAAQQGQYNQLMMQQSLANAQAQARQPGLGGMLLSAGGQALGSYFGGFGMGQALGAFGGGGGSGGGGGGFLPSFGGGGFNPYGGLGQGGGLYL